MQEFYQNPPTIKNTFLNDKLLVHYLNKKIPKEFQADIFKHLEHVGQLASTNWLNWSMQAMQTPPVHIPFDAWGKRIDYIQVSDGWKKLETAAATEGIIATAYERKFQHYSRLYQMSLLYLYSPSSAFYSCPLAMTDGAARALELYGNTNLKNTAFQNLTSRDPKKFWTSGQWMTERTGGSDVSLTSTKAKWDNEGFYRLYGTKWFTSATTSQMALTLARIDESVHGNKGLSMFFLQLKDENDILNQIEVHRLKDKLGTRALPTAELSLKGTPATLIGNQGDGIKTIASVLNITRIYNSICALSHMRRALDLAWDYASKRKAFGSYLVNLPLHKKTLSDLEKIFEKCFYFTFFVCELLGKEETGVATDLEKKLLRALTPLVKLYTGKKVIEISSEVIESFGGAGYIEDTGLTYLLKDAQVFSIWEGTTNVLSLDFLRVCEKENALDTIFDLIQPDKKIWLEIVDKNKLTAEMARDLSFAVSEQLIHFLIQKNAFTDI